jgi:hypothetical protein
MVIHNIYQLKTTKPLYIFFHTQNKKIFILLRCVYNPPPRIALLNAAGLFNIYFCIFSIFNKIVNKIVEQFRFNFGIEPWFDRVWAEIIDRVTNTFLADSEVRFQSISAKSIIRQSAVALENGVISNNSIICSTFAHSFRNSSEVSTLDQTSR